MDVYNSKISAFMAAIGTGFVWLFGSWDVPMITLLVFIALDYLTGLAKAFINKQLSSEYGSKGIIRKTLILVILIVAVSIDRIIGHDWFFRSAVCFWYIANEGLSILENITALGVPIPEKLKEALLQLKEGNKKYSERG